MQKFTFLSFCIKIKKIKITFLIIIILVTICSYQLKTFIMNQLIINASTIINQLGFYYPPQSVREEMGDDEYLAYLVRVIDYFKGDSWYNGYHQAEYGSIAFQTAEFDHPDVCGLCLEPIKAGENTSCWGCLNHFFHAWCAARCLMSTNQRMRSCPNCSHPWVNYFLVKTNVTCIDGDFHYSHSKVLHFDLTLDDDNDGDDDNE